MKRTFWFVLALGILFGLAALSSAKTRKKTPPAPPALLGTSTTMELGNHVARLGLVLDATTGELTARLLEVDSQERVRVVQDGIRINGLVGGKKFTVKLEPVPDPATGEKKWDDSVFRGKSEDLVGADRFEGSFFFLRVKGVNFQNLRFRYDAAGSGKTETPEEKH